MSFKLVKYTEPDFDNEKLKNAPDAVMLPAPKDGVVPDNYHGTTIFPEYFKVSGDS